VNTGVANGDPRPWHERPNSYNREVGLAVTTTSTGILGLWHYLFIHEFGHSFGGLADEDYGRSVSNRSANVCINGGAKWGHWIGTEGITTRSIGNNLDLVVPTRAMFGCIMKNMDYNWKFDSQFPALSFCRVCSAELTRRLAYLSGECFHNGISPRTFVPEYSPSRNRSSVVAISQGANRILPYAFHGNSVVNNIIIPPTVQTIGEYAFIGAINLQTIIM